MTDPNLAELARVQAERDRLTKECECLLADNVRLRQECTDNFAAGANIAIDRERMRHVFDAAVRWREADRYHTETCNTCQPCALLDVGFCARHLKSYEASLTLMGELETTIDSALAKEQP